MNATHFTLLRHGLPEQADCLLGRTDPELTEKGWQQMQRSSAQLTYDIIISSPLTRCSAFASQLANLNNCPFELDHNWQEINFGLWDGQKIDKLWSEQHGYEQYWQAPFIHTPPMGESSAALITRLTHTIETLSRQYQGKQILIITHSGVMRMLLAWLLNGTHQGNAHLSRVKLDHAAILQFSTHIDENDTLWPQLQGFSNPMTNALGSRCSLNNG